ncbi:MULTISPECIES: hypothetical protein [unclassified Bradyrhizobium]|uniref:hypothetical protein n=1 Tax=unclassified Bradyrhizobium TaxID=2631580 RepID=UPI0028EC474B|nr:MULTISPECIES: hypothetical protein [unclassified Bradyrhizobium]
MTVRIDAVVRVEIHAAAPTRPPHPASTFVTTAKRPSCETGSGYTIIISGKKKVVFCSWTDWRGDVLELVPEQSVLAHVEWPNTAVQVRDRVLQFAAAKFLESSSFRGIRAQNGVAILEQRE